MNTLHVPSRLQGALLCISVLGLGSCAAAKDAGDEKPGATTQVRMPWKVASSAMLQARYDHSLALLGDGRLLACGGTTDGVIALRSCELMDAHNGLWTAAPDMSVARSGAAASVLPSGRILVCGGGTSSCELYDPWKNAWESAPSMAGARTEGTLTLLLDGRVLAVGGGIGSTETFAEGSKAWVSVGSIGQVKGATATLLASGRVLVAGGVVGSGPSSEVYRFDPATNQWGQAMSLPGPRAQHSATRLRDGRVIVAGGTDGTNDLESVVAYSEVTGAWTAASPMVRPRRQHAAVLKPNGELELLGGKSGSTILASSETYDGAGWTSVSTLQFGRYRCGAVTLGSGDVVMAGGLGVGGHLSSVESDAVESIGNQWQDVRSMSQQRVSHTVTRLADGSVLVVGGVNGSGGTLATAERYNPVTKTWTGAGSMAQSRWLHTATLLKDGTVLVAGGWDHSSTALATAELFDPASNSWSFTGAMPQPRYHHSATRLLNGRVLLIGGNAPGALYDPTTRSWSLTATPILPRYQHTATLLSNGHVLLVGGSVSQTKTPCVEDYDPAANSFRTVGNVIQNRSEHGATLLPGGRVLVAGGAWDAGAMKSAEIYDPSTESWRSVEPMAEGRMNHAQTQLTDGRVLVSGNGESDAGSASAELFDPVSERWSSAGLMATAHAGPTSVLVGDGTVLVAGNTTGPAGADAEIYHPAYSRWRPTGPMTSPRLEANTATLLPDGKVLIAGGYDENLNPNETVDMFDPTSGLWNAGKPLIEARVDHTATLLGDGRVLVAGGEKYDILRSAELYDPGSDNWTSAPPMNELRRLHTATLLKNGDVLMVGGSPSLNTVEVYDNAAGAWRYSAPLVHGREGHTATLLRDGKVLVTGGSGNVTHWEVFDSDTESWTTGGSTIKPRANHSATLLGDGTVLVTGNYYNNTLSSVPDLFDPSAGTWTSIPGTMHGGYSRAAPLLLNGKVMLAGGPGPVEVLDRSTLAWLHPGDLTADIYVGTATSLSDGKVLAEGLEYESTTPSARVYEPYPVDPQSRPVINSITQTPAPGGVVTLTGSRFRSATEASSGTSLGASSNHPIITLTGLSSKIPWWIAPTSFTDKTVTFTVPAGHPLEITAVRVIVGGIASVSQVMRVMRGGNGDPCKASSDCLSTNCVNGVCCSSSSCGTCSDCNTELSVGTCRPLPRYTDDNEPPGSCTGESTCNGAGLCLFKNGNGCASSGQCESGHCVDGVCCEADCTSTCQACNVAGSEGLCRTLPSGSHDSFPANACAPPSACDGQGMCKKQLGVACVGSNECASSYCVDGVCCDTACSAACMSCIVLGSEGTCSATSQGTADAPTCWNGKACDGTAVGMAACKAANGASCAAGTECASGQCVDSVCCVSACDTPCSVCGAAGVCGFIPAGQQDSFPSDACTGDSACNGSGGCSKAVGKTCAKDDECLTQLCRDGVCCQETCDGTCMHCVSTGACVPVALGQPDDVPAGACVGSQSCDGTGHCKMASGASCASASDCLSKYCVDGVCCDQACSRQCEACDVAGSVGICAAVPDGETPRGSREPCVDKGDGCAGKCNGTNPAVCTYPNETNSCGTPTCEDGTAHQPVCDGSGTCSKAVDTKCVKFACAEKGCRTSCTTDAECGAQFRCDTAKKDCVPAGARCDGNHTLVATDGPPTDCAPYRCNTTHVCLNQCTSRADCIVGMACTAEGKCEPDTIASEETGSCSCRVVGARSPVPAAVALLIASGIALARRKRARNSHESRCTLH